MCLWCSVDEDVGEMDFEKNQLKLVPCQIHEGLADWRSVHTLYLSSRTFLVQVGYLGCLQSATLSSFLRGVGVESSGTVDFMTE